MFQFQKRAVDSQVPSRDFWKDAELDSGQHENRSLSGASEHEQHHEHANMFIPQESYVQMLLEFREDGSFEPRPELPISAGAFLYRGAPWEHFALVESMLRD